MSVQQPTLHGYGAFDLSSTQPNQAFDDIWHSGGPYASSSSSSSLAGGPVYMQAGQGNGMYPSISGALSQHQFHQIDDDFAGAQQHLQQAQQQVQQAHQQFHESNQSAFDTCANSCCKITCLALCFFASVIGTVIATIAVGFSTAALAPVLITAGVGILISTIALGILLFSICDCGTNAAIAYVTH